VTGWKSSCSDCTFASPRRYAPERVELTQERGAEYVRLRAVIEQVLRDLGSA